MTFELFYYNIMSLYERKEEKLAKQRVTAQDWLPFDRIFEDGIIENNGNFIKIIKVIPINYDLKSNLEKESILNSFKLFLKTCDFNMQILIQSRKEDLNSYISQIKSQIETEKNEKLKEIFSNYINFLQIQNKERNSSSKNFFILVNYQIKEKEEYQIKFIRDNLNEKYFKIKDSLSRCGNLVFDISTKKEAEKTLYSFCNLRMSLKFL